MNEVLKQVIDTALNISSVLENPRDRGFGHFALPTFGFAKELRKNPQIIAQEFAQKLEHLPQIAQVSVVNGYVNLSLSDSFLGECAYGFLHKTQNKAQKERILLEYVSANPTGPLHIGHARGAVFGDSLARIGKFLGYDIVTEYYINDAGAQVENLGISIYCAGRHLFWDAPYELPEGCYRGDYVLDLAKDARECFGAEIFCNEENIAKLSLFGKDKMLLEIQANLALLGIVFDNYVSEKELFGRWDSVLETLRAHNGIYEKEGKIWLKSTEYGDQKDRVVVRESGEPTYLAGDIIYHQDKFLRDFERYINIWGADHHGYITRVKAAVEFLGFESERLEILLSQMVALLKGGEAYKMSKRAGNFILLKDVAEDVGADALRLVFLSKKPDTHLEFDVEELKKQDASNPVYYINYAHARIFSLFEKSKFSFSELRDSELTHFVESLRDLSESLRDLLFLALGLEKALSDAFKQRLPNKVVDYLRNLASEFHRFYNETRILGVLIVVAHSIALGLMLLGIQAKTKM